MKKLFVLLICILYLTPSSSAVVVSGYLSPGNISIGGVEQAVYDLDNNGQFDFQVNFVLVGFDQRLRLKGLNGTKFETDGNLKILGYNAGTPLGNNTYQDSGYVDALYFPDFVEKYASLKFKINNVYHCAYFEIFPFGLGDYSFSLFGYETNSSECLNAAALTSLPEHQESGSNVNTHIFPNPFEGQANFEIEGLDSRNYSKLSLVIVNSYGQEVSRISGIRSSKFQLSSASLAKGIYFYRLFYDGENISDGSFLIE